MNLAYVSVISNSGPTRERLEETECKRMQRRETEYRHTKKEREKETQRDTHTHTRWKILLQKEHLEE